MSIEAMKQALEALKLIDEAMPFPVAKHAMSTLRTAIAEAESVEGTVKKHLPVEQEPVAWMFVNSDGECEQIEYGAFDMDDQSSITLLYTTPTAAQQEPKFECPRCGHCCARGQA